MATSATACSFFLFIGAHGTLGLTASATSCWFFSANCAVILAASTTTCMNLRRESHPTGRHQRGNTKAGEDFLQILAFH